MERIYFVIIFLMYPCGISSEFVPLLQDPTGWTAYYTTNPSDFSTEAKLARFPQLYELENLSTRMLGPPGDFRATVIERETIEDPGVFYPGVNITFTTTDSADSGLRGFEICLKRVTFEFFMVLDFTGVANLTAGMAYTLEVFPLSGLVHYRIHMTSLPVYNVNQSTEPVSVITGVFGAGKFAERSQSPASWFAAMRYELIPSNHPNDHHDNDRQIEVVFSRPPESYGFRRFQLALVPEDHKRQMQVVTIETFVHVFSGVQPGSYQLMVKPVDDYFSIYGRCLCRLTSGTCTNCVTTKMQTFRVV